MKELDESTVGGRIRKMRIAAGLTQGDLAKLLKTARPNVSDYEHNKRTFSIEKLLQMAVVFNCSIDYLMTGSVTAAETMESMVIQKFREITSPKLRLIVYREVEVAAQCNAKWDND